MIYEELVIPFVSQEDDYEGDVETDDDESSDDEPEDLE